MQAAPWLAGRGGTAQGIVLLLLVVLGLACYVLCLRWFGVAGMRDLVEVARRRA
jgi:hypothetical protein